jgi:tetratricopeptide (TPR) repeat protein
MGWHLPFDGTERLLTRGQRALQRRDWARAETLLRQALGRDAAYAHLHLYLALALAEQERLPEAERALDRASELAPDNFVFPLHRALVRLDAGDAAGARAPLETAARLAPDNPLVAGYADLIGWELGHEPVTDPAAGANVLAALARRARDLPESFRARLLLRALAAMLATRGPKAALNLLEPPPDPPLGITLPPTLRARWRRRRLASAERLIAASRFEDAADHLAAQPDVLEQPGAAALLERARRGAVRELTVALDRAQPRERGGLLLRRYEHEHALRDRDAAYATLGAWQREHAAAGAPRRDAPVAAEVARRMAEIDVERGAYERALQHAADSLAQRPSREAAGVQALALLGLGRPRPARHGLEDFLADALFPIDVTVQRALDSPA